LPPVIRFVLIFQCDLLTLLVVQDPEIQCLTIAEQHVFSKILTIDYPDLSSIVPALKRGVNGIVTLIACILLFQMPRAETRSSLLSQVDQNIIQHFLIKLSHIRKEKPTTNFQNQPPQARCLSFKQMLSFHLIREFPAFSYLHQRRYRYIIVP
jgi:hypothetical protein